MIEFIQTVIDGIADGSIYAALALALVLIFRSTDIINFAQGEMAMFGTFVAWGLHEAGLGVGLAIVAALAFSFLGGLVVERAVIRPFEGRDHLTLLIVTLGLFVLFNSAAGWIWGFDNRAFPSAFPDGSASAGDLRISWESIGIIAVLIVVGGALRLVFLNTSIGLAIRAAASDPDSARLSGVDVGRMLMLGWGMAALLGTLAGTLVAPQLFLDVNMMGGVMIYAFAAAAAGGMDSPAGAVVGGWLIGVAESLASRYIDFIGADLEILVPLAIIFVVLLARPTGLFGSPAVARA